MDKRVDKEVQLQLKKIQKNAEVQARSNVSKEMKDLKKENEILAKNNKKSEALELAYRNKLREANNKLASFDLEVARKVEGEIEKAQSDTEVRLTEQFGLLQKKYEETIKGLNEEIKALNNKVERGSERLQGEVMELQLEDLLRNAFPEDSIRAVPKGAEGADVLQFIHQNGKHYGKIIWESKRTQSWSNKWIDKVKRDQLEAEADVAVIVSSVLPDGIQSFGFKDDVCISGLMYSVPLAAVLRNYVLGLAKTRIASQGKNEKKEDIYNYITGSIFRQNIQAVVKSFKVQYDDIISEQGAMKRSWKKRETEIKNGVAALANIYGTMQGIAGNALSNIPALELPGQNRALPVASSETAGKREHSA